MRKLAAVVLFLVLMLVACRSEEERAALARSASEATRTVAVEDGFGSPAAGVEARRVWVSDHVAFQEAAISPDGRYVTEMDESSGDLAVRDLATGLLHRLTHKGSWEDSIDYFQNASFSPDGRRLAFSWYDDATSNYEIHALNFSVDGEAPPRSSDHRVVYPGHRPQSASLVYDWVSDDEVLIGIYRPGNARALAFLTLSTGQVRVLKSFEWGAGPAQVRVSPDGRFIAYDRPSRAGGADSPDRDVYLLSADGRREARLTEGPGVDVVLDWVPGDGSLVFHRRRSGDGSVWRLPMSDGRPTGDPVLIQSNVLDPKPIGFAKNAFYYGLEVERPAYETASLDREGRALRKLPMRFEAPPGGRIRAFAWTPDGEHVLQEIEHPRSPGGGWIQLRTIDGELVREWSFDLFIWFTLFRWAPDGSVLVAASDDRERGGFYRIDLETGEPGMVLRFDRGGEFGRVSAISPDGRRLYFTRHQTIDGRMDESFADVVEHDLATGAERPIERVGGHGALTMSPDGKWLALALGPPTGPKTIRVIPVQGGEPHIVYRGGTTTQRPPRVLGWDADSGSLLFIDRQPSDEESEVGLYRVSRDGGDADRIATIDEYGGGVVSLHPDGRTIAYRTGEPRGEIWALEDLAEMSSTISDDREGSR